MKKFLSKYIMKSDPPVGSTKFLVANIIIPSFELVILLFIFYVYGGYYILGSITNDLPFTWKDWSAIIASVGFFPIVLSQLVELINDIQKAQSINKNQ